MISGLEIKSDLILLVFVLGTAMASCDHKAVQAAQHGSSNPPQTHGEAIDFLKVSFLSFFEKSSRLVWLHGFMGRGIRSPFLFPMGFHLQEGQRFLDACVLGFLKLYMYKPGQDKGDSQKRKKKKKKRQESAMKSDLLTTVYREKCPSGIGFPGLILPPGPSPPQKSATRSWAHVMLASSPGVSSIPHGPACVT